MNIKKLIDYNLHKFELKLFERDNDKTAVEIYCVGELSQFVKNTSIGRFAVYYKHDSDVNWKTLYDDNDTLIFDKTVRSQIITNVSKIIRLYVKRCNANKIELSIIGVIIHNLAKNMGRYISLDNLTRYNFHPCNYVFNELLLEYNCLSITNFRNFCESEFVGKINVNTSHIIRYLKYLNLPVIELEECIKIIRTTNKINYSPVLAVLHIVLDIDCFGLDFLESNIKTLSNENEEIYCDHHGRYRHILVHILDILQFHSMGSVLRYEIVKLLIKYNVSIKSSRDELYSTILYTSPSNDELKMFILLVENGVDINGITEPYFSRKVLNCLGHLTFERVYKFIKFLLKLGLDISRFELVTVLEEMFVNTENLKESEWLKVIKLLLKNEIAYNRTTIGGIFPYPRVNNFFVSMGFTHKTTAKGGDVITTYPNLRPSLYTLCLRKVLTTKSIDTKGFPKLLLKFQE